MADFAFNPKYTITRTKHTVDGNPIHKEMHNSNYDIHKDGTKIGEMNTRWYSTSPRTVNVSNIKVEGGPNSIGPSAVRQVSSQLKQEYPKATRVKGERISGARTGDYKYVGPIVSAKLK